MKKLLLSAVVLAAICLGSCKKNNPSPTYNANVMFVNGCAGTVSVNVTQQSTAVPGATNLGYLKYSGYQSLPGGNDSIAFVLASTGIALETKTASFTVNQNYSVFLGGIVNSSSVLVTSDDLTPPSSGNAKIRLVNLSQDALSLTGSWGSNNNFATGITSGVASSFVSIPAGNYKITAGDPANLSSVVSLNSQQYVSGKIYTIVYSGTSAGSLSLSLTLIGNN